MASIDLTKLNANSAEIQRIAAAAAAGDSAAIQAAQAAQLESDQAALDAATAQQASDIAPLSAQFPPPVATPLAVSPSSITGTVGATLSQTLAVTGGTAPFTFASSLADVTVSATGDVGGTPAAAEMGEITVTDSATPSPASVTVPVSIS